MGFVVPFLCCSVVGVELLERNMGFIQKLSLNAHLFNDLLAYWYWYCFICFSFRPGRECRGWADGAKRRENHHHTTQHPSQSRGRYAVLTDAASLPCLAWDSILWMGFWVFLPACLGVCSCCGFLIILLLVLCYVSCNNRPRGSDYLKDDTCHIVLQWPQIFILILEWALNCYIVRP